MKTEPNTRSSSNNEKCNTQKGKKQTLPNKFESKQLKVNGVLIRL